MTPNATKARRARLEPGRVSSAWRRRDKPGLLHELGPEMFPWARLSRTEAKQELERERRGWLTTQNPALLLSAIEGCQTLGVCPAWMADAARDLLLVGFGEMPLVRRNKPWTLKAWWRQHQQHMIDRERCLMLSELRDRFALTWDDAAAVTALVWLGGFVTGDAVKASCQRVWREIKAGRAARYFWTPADERFLRTLKADRRHAASWVKANEELTRVLARRGKTRDDYEGHDSEESW